MAFLPGYALRAGEVFHHPRVKTWCGLPYPGHPRGCPNYGGTRPHCPHNSPYITEVLDLKKPVYLVFSEFDLAAHVEVMRAKHFDWTDRQLRNVLYWQRRSKKQAMIRAVEIARIVGANKLIPMGESYGVQLYKTCAHVGLKLERIKGLKICRHVVLVGHGR